MTLASSGLAYVVAVWCVYRLGRPLRPGRVPRLLLTASFGLATVALPYARHVNNHVLLLGVTAALMLGLVRLAEARAAGRLPWGWLAALGTLAGLGYTIDLGVGPVLVVCAVALVACPLPAAGGRWLVFALAALPWLAAAPRGQLRHRRHAACRPTRCRPTSTGPAARSTPDNMTGGWKHDERRPLPALRGDLLVGQAGLPRPQPAAVPGCCRRCGICCGAAPELPEVLFAGCLCGGIWLMYAVNSNNSSGLCLLGPLVRAAAGARRTTCWPSSCSATRGTCATCCVLSAGGLLLHGPGLVATVRGFEHMVPGFWPVQAAALFGLVEYRLPPGDCSYGCPRRPARQYPR